MFCSRDDPPTAGRDGRQFIVLVRDNLDDVVQRAHLAGLTIEIRQPTTTTDPAHPTDWVDPVKLQQQAAAPAQAAQRQRGDAPPLFRRIRDTGSGFHLFWGEQKCIEH
jgi:hypothetical protein